MIVMVTGALGFVGRSLCQRLNHAGHDVIATTRKKEVPSLNLSPSLAGQITPTTVGELNSTTDWSHALDGVKIVVHLASRVHVMQDTVADPLTEFRKINQAGTYNLARQAAATGVRRFIFISSIKVNGEATLIGKPFKEDDIPVPVEPYAISKHKAELGLQQLAVETGMEVVIIRPPLVYGPGVKANFLSMMRWLYKGVPLPLGAILNKRSLVAIDNLVDLIVTCIEHPAAANQTFLVADGVDLSTTELLRKMGDALGKPVRLLPVPTWLLKTGAILVGKHAVVQRLCGSLQVDISKSRKLLDWSPPVSVEEAMRKTAKYFLESQLQ